MAILLFDEADGIATLTLNQPDKLNPLSDDMLAAMHETLDKIARSNAKVVIIKASGRAFCAGHDLKEIREKRAGPDKGRAALATLFDQCAQMMLKLQALPQPVIAQVHGLATAAGCQLVATCDMAIAADTARFGVNGVNIGLFCSTPMVALTRNIPRKAAFEMLTTGKFLSANEAASLGLVNRAVPEADLEAETMELARTVAGKLGAAVRYGKGAFYAQAALDTRSAYQLTGDVMIANMSEDDTAEGIAAFLEKRPPNWPD